MHYFFLKNGATEALVDRIKNVSKNEHTIETLPEKAGEEYSVLTALLEHIPEKTSRVILQSMMNRCVSILYK